MEENRRPLQVLLVEDSTWTIDSLMDLVRSTSISTEICLARTEDEALESMALRPTDIVVLDLKLKEGHGFRVLRQLATLTYRPSIIVLTNFALPRYRELALLLGADVFLDKATDFLKVPSIIESIAKTRNLNALPHSV